MPIVECVLKHTSVQMDGKRPRSVDMEIDTQSTGEMALRMNDLSEGSAIRVVGFLAKRSLNSTRLVLHIQDIVNQHS